MEAIEKYTEEEKRKIVMFAERAAYEINKFNEVFSGDPVEREIRKRAAQEEILRAFDQYLKELSGMKTRIHQDRRFLLDIAVRAQEPLKDALKIATTFMETGKVEE